MPDKEQSENLSDAIRMLKERAADHEADEISEYHEYAAGIRDALKALEPYLVGGHGKY